MYLTKRQREILLFLSSRVTKPGDVIPGKHIAEHLKVSLRTVQSEIAAINRESFLPVILSDNRGYSLNSRVLEELELTPKTDEDETGAILKLLLRENCPRDIDEMADMLYISTSALVKKLKQTEPFLEHYELGIERHKNKVSICGSETHKRRMIHEIIMSEIGQSSDCFEIAANYLNNINIAEIQSVVFSVIKEHDYFIETCYTTNLIMNILTAFSRIAGHFNTEEMNLPGFENMPEYGIASDICREVSDRLRITLNQNDVLYITLLITGQVKPVSEEYMITEEEHRRKEIITEIIQRTFGTYMLHVESSTFLPDFIRHIKSLIIRSKNQQYAINLITGNLRETSPFVYDVAVHLAKSLEDEFHIQITEDETGLLAIYTGFIVEQSAACSDKINVLLVCDNYKNMASGILKQMNAFFSDSVNILDVVTSPGAVSRYDNVELIIHTQPVHAPGKTCVAISPFWSEEDRSKVQSAVSTLTDLRSRRESRDLLLNYFGRDLFFIDQNIHTGQEAIEFLGSKAEAAGLCKEGFTELVKKRESMSSTCFMDSFAVPHSPEPDAERTFLAVLVEENGISWGESRIKIVLMIAVRREDRQEFMKIYNGIIHYLIQENAVDKLAAAKNFDEFISCFTEID